ncbi:MAG: excinuclease ABC subunit UvrA [Victivallales bacterium]|nr:excinuclease ABC subunit UvrA [Victivallales bacterium]
MPSHIKIKGARQHNLKGIDVEIPRDKLVVITGPSGSGKSSLAFDTLYAEGQRRYVESLSSYARQFLDRMQKPDVEHIEGLSPAIAIEQRTAGTNPRSTVATSTEIYDYLRLLFAHVGHPHCPKCGKSVAGQSAEAICRRIRSLPPGRKMIILAPYVVGKKGEHRDILDKIKDCGFVRARIDGVILDLDDAPPKLDKKKKHTVEAVVDRLITGENELSRLNDSIEMALHCGNGNITVLTGNSDGSGDPEQSRGWTEEKISEHLACTDCNISFAELKPRNFSFNSPYGACPECHGIGSRMVFSETLLIPNKSLSIKTGAIPAWRRGPRRLIIYYNHLLKSIAEHFKMDDLLTRPFEDIPEHIRNVLLHGSGEDPIKFDFWMRGKMHRVEKPFEGIMPNLERRFAETESESVRERLKNLMRPTTCPSCKGKRLRPESLAVTIGNKPAVSIDTFNSLPVENALEFITSLTDQLNTEEAHIAHEIIREIASRLGFLRDVGLSYLTLDRESGSLSGGEAQRIRLATQIGSGLTGVLYILDEPSIGLHQRDNIKLLDTLQRLRDTGNTVIVVEHDLETIRRADHVIDLGPAAGKHGGEIVAQGTPQQVAKSKTSLTGAYLSGRKDILVPKSRHPGNGQFITIKGARHNNLKNITVDIPLGVFCCVTGVSGSGKSSLVDDTLRVALEKRFFNSLEVPGEHDSIQGLGHIGKAIVIDQSPIGRTPRSNPATYTNAFTTIRDLFARLQESKTRGYKPGRFSFNVKGGRCEECKGDGVKKIEMQFLPDVYVTCNVCNGKRFNRETLSIFYKGRSISDILDMTVNEAVKFFAPIPALARKLDTLQQVGLGYIHLGQPATTLSGGEAQRVKLATELAKTPRGHTIYILDEPTTGLHIDDVNTLMDVILMLRDKGNTVLVIEHNLDLVKACDYVIDLGPEGGSGGGEVVAQGTPEQIAKATSSHTGKYLEKMLQR